MNTTQPSIFGSNTAQTSKPFGGSIFERNLYIGLGEGALNMMIECI